MVGAVPWAGSEPLFLARERGLMPSEHLRLVEFVDSADMIRAFRNGALDAVALTLDEALRLEALGLEPRVVLVLDASHGADCVVARPEVKTLAELQGRRVALEHMSLGLYMLGRALEEAGLRPEDVRRVPTRLDSHLEVYQRGAVDAVVTFEPNCQQLVDAGAHVLFDSSRIPEEILDVLVVRKSYLAANPERIDVLVRGWFSALDYLGAHPDEAERLMAPRLGIPPQQLRKALAGVRLLDARPQREQLTGPAPRLRETLQRLRGVMSKDGLLPARPREDSLLLDASALLRVAP